MEKTEHELRMDVKYWHDKSLAAEQELSERNGEYDLLECAHNALKERNKELQAFADQLDFAAQNREDVSVFGVDYLAYPVDADGRVIHLGDMVHADDGTVGQVFEIKYNKLLSKPTIKIESPDVYSYPTKVTYWFPEQLNHYRRPTVEDVLRDFMREFNRSDTELCDDEIIEQFAAKLQLKEVVDD